MITIGDFVYVYFPQIIDHYTKIPKKKSFRKNLGRKIAPVCLEQNNLRSKLKKIKPSLMQPIEDNEFGVDYFFNGITIDQKFSFGALGENTIKIRVRKRKLLNKSNWTMIVNKKGEIEFFETEKLADFVRKNWGIIQKHRLEEKKDYTSYAVKLNDFYKIEDVKVTKTIFNKEDLLLTLKEISVMEETNVIYQTENEKNKALSNDYFFDYSFTKTKELNVHALNNLI